MENYILTTDRLGLRRWTDEDLVPFAEMNDDPEVKKYFPKTLSMQESSESMKRIRDHFEKNNFGLMVVEDKQTSQFMGITGFHIPAFEFFFTPCVEIGWRLKKEYWGRGFAAEAARACLAYGFETLQLKEIVSFTSVLNKSSENLMKRIGMVYVTDFDHPLIETDHLLCRHVLYQIPGPPSL